MTNPTAGFTTTQDALRTVADLVEEYGMSTGAAVFVLRALADELEAQDRRDMDIR